MNRHLNILDHTLRAMIRRWPSHLFVLVVLVIVFFTAFSLMLVVQSLDCETSEILKTAPDITVMRYQLGRQVPIEKEKTDAIQNIWGVASASYRTWAYYNDPYTGAVYTVWGVAPDRAGRLGDMDIVFKDGRFWNSGDQGKVVIGDGVAKALMLNDRKNFALKNCNGDLVNFEVSGIFSASASLLTADLILMAETDFYPFFSLAPELATDISVSVPNAAEAPVIAQKIQNLLPDCRTVLKSQLRQSYAAVLNHRTGLLLYTWSGCLAAFLLILWLKGYQLSGEEQKELGLLKTLGWSSGDVLEVKLLEALTISCLAAVTGFLAAWVHIYLLDAPLFKPVLYGWSAIYPAFPLVPAVSFGQLCFIMLLVSIPYTGATLMASWRFIAVDAAALLTGDRQ